MSQEVPQLAGGDQGGEAAVAALGDRHEDENVEPVAPPHAFLHCLVGLLS